MNKLDTLLNTIKAALKYRISTERSRRSPERAKASTRGRSVYTIPCVAYTTVRCRDYGALGRRKVVDRF
jgi:adenylosuccinate synthase